VLAARHRGDLPDAHGKFEIAPDGILRTRPPHQLKSCIAPASGPHSKLRIHGISVYNSDPRERIPPGVRAVPVALIIHSHFRSVYVAENQGVVGLVLETDDHIDNFYSVLRRKAKVGDRRGEIGSIRAQRLVSAS
jgi:hypothetical protein